MIYLGYQHSVKMIVMQYDEMVSFSGCSSGLTWYMFMHVVNQNQHSLYNVYVRGVHILLMLVSNFTYA